MREKVSLRLFAVCARLIFLLIIIGKKKLQIEPLYFSFILKLNPQFIFCIFLDEYTKDSCKRDYHRSDVAYAYAF